MYEQEKQRTTHLMILIYKTIFIIGWTCAAIFFKWDTWVVMLFLLGLITCWILHISEKIPESLRLWVYFIFSMLAFFYCGIHEAVVYDMAPGMVLFILVYTLVEKYSFIRLCAITYYLTMCYDFVFVIGNPFKFPVESLFRILFHFLFIFIAERFARAMIRRRKEERKKTDERISRLEEANQSVEDFLANVSHELRTPINAVTGITTVMLKNEESEEKKKDILSIQMAGNRLFGQIEDILDYTEIDTGRVIASEESYMIFSLINDIIIENQLTKWDKDVELIFDIDAGIPSVLLGDEKKIKKIIKHLIDNAVKFTKRGGVYVRVHALPKTYGINLCIQVSDTGIGIAEEELELIIEKCFRTSGGRSRKARGLGLGLSIVYGMVTALDGFIRLESTEGSGTTVSVSIPQKVVDNTPSMEVQNRDDLCIALYLKPEKYKVPEVRDYYNKTISHLVQGLGLMVHRVFDSEELKKLIDMYQLTHLVVGREEYEENAAYFEALDDIEVVVSSDDDFLPADSRVTLMKKPFYCLPIVNILNTKTSFIVDEFEKEKNMICPGVRVLVVDDEPMNLMVAEGIFEEYRMKVRTAGSGMEAVELCKKEEFDLIFLDHMMPEMDGIETLKRLRRIQADAGKIYTIIAFTANAVSGAREMFLQEDFDEFISKPIEDHELRRLLKKVLPKSSITYMEEKPASGKDSKKDKLIKLNEIGFHTESGLQYCRGDREFYEEVLIKFAQDAERRINDIEAFFQKEDIANYQIMVHALKSSSKMAGADRLSEMAKTAEDAARNRDFIYIRENHEELIGKYRNMANGVLDVLCPAEKAQTKEASADGTEISRDELLRQLSELEESLKTFEADKAENILTRIDGYVYKGTSISTLLRDVRQDVADFELGSAAARAAEIIGGVEGGEI